MKGILFRGKGIFTDKWEYGYLIDNIYGGTPVIVTESLLNDGNYIEIEYEHIKPETVGQYTGLTDKNGEKIFEGDIVKYNETFHKVVFETRGGSAYFGIVINDIETWGFGNEVPSNLMEVVGNIYDNPELITECEECEK